MAPPRIAVGIVNHNTRVDLFRCLETVLRQDPAHTIVVDTASTDGSASMVRQEFPDAELRVMENRGYGAAGNVAVRATRTPYVLLLNSDALLGEGALPALAGYLERQKQAGIAGPRIVDGRGVVQSTARRFPTLFQILLQESQLHRLSVWRKRGLRERPQLADWVLGAALAIRRDAFESVGGFDESYFMYNEEIDLCLRLQSAGWEVHYAPVATVTHVGGASTSQQRPAMSAQFVRGTLTLYRRHRPAREGVYLRLLLGAILGARLLRDRTRLFVAKPERRAHLGENLQAWRAGLAELHGDLATTVRRGGRPAA